MAFPLERPPPLIGGGGDIFDQTAFLQWFDKISRHSRSNYASVTVTTDYSFGAEVGRVDANATSAALAITLPPAGNFGRRCGVKKTDSSANAVTVTAAGTDTIDGAATYALSAQYDALIVRDTGSQWVIESKFSTTIGNAATATALQNARTINGISFDGTANITVMQSAPGVRGAKCLNNSGTPNTQYDLNADEVVLRNSSGFTVLRTAPGAITNNISTAGSTANGRDQAAAFTNGSWVHFYWIWNGTTLATVSSATAPPTGPTLPSGYTHWAYAGAIYLSAGGALLKTRILGGWVFYDKAATDGVALSAGSATVETSISLSALVPPNAQSIDIIAIGSSTNTSNTNQLLIRSVSGSNQFNPVVAIAEASGITQQWGNCGGIVPNVSQNLYYLWTTTGGGAYINVIGYSVPNGG